uniref:Uncharacterized protein n=1 Tax=Exserohilum turcicum narnavirus 6 TaxID=3229038 RepID=A0AAU7YCD0_9VIRU
MTAMLEYQYPCLPVISREVTLPVGACPTPDMRLKRCIEIGAELPTSSPVPVENLVNPRLTGQDPLSTTVDRLGPPLSRYFDFLWSTLTKPSTTCQIRKVRAHRRVCANLTVGGESVPRLWFVNLLGVEPSTDLGNSRTELTSRGGNRGVSKGRYESGWVMCSAMCVVLTQVQLEQPCSSACRNPKLPFTGMPQSAEHSRKFGVPTLTRRDRSLTLVQSTSASSQAVERARVHGMLAHDPITVTDKLLQGWGSKGPKRRIVEQCVGFTEHKANLRPKALTLMEFASYCRGSLRIGRDVLGMCESGKIISANDPTAAQPLTHPVIEDTQYREGARGTHKGTAQLRDIDCLPILVHTKTSSKLRPRSLRELRLVVTDIMHVMTNSEITLEFGTKKSGETSFSKALDDSQDGIMSETVSRPGQVCREVDFSRHEPTQPLQDFLFSMRGIRKDLRNSSKESGPEDLANQVSLGEDSGRRDGNDSCLHPQLCDNGGVMSHTSRRGSQQKRCGVRHVTLRTDNSRVHNELITPYSPLGRVLEVRRKSGRFFIVLVTDDRTTPCATLGNTAPPSACQIGQYLIITSILTVSFNHCACRRRHRVTIRMLECSSQDVGDMFLNTLQCPLGSNMSIREVSRVYVQSFFLRRVTRCWESTSQPTKGQLSFYSETTIQERKELCGEMVGLRKSCTTTLKGSCPQGVTDILKGSCNLFPSHAIARKGYPPTHFPRTATCSNATRNQSTPSRFPKLLGVHRHPTTRDLPLRSPPACY